MGNTETLDLIVRNPDTGAVAIAANQPDLGGPSHFEGVLTDGGEQVGFTSSVDRELAGTLKFEEISGESGTRLNFFDSEGQQSAEYELTYVRAQGRDQKLEFWAGSYRAGDVEFDFVASSDPVEPTFYIAGIAALACLVKFGLDHITGTSRKLATKAIQDCIDKGGSPRYRVESTFGLKLKPLEIGCSFRCEFDGCTYGSD